MYIYIYIYIRICRQYAHTHMVVCRRCASVCVCVHCCYLAGSSCGCGCIGLLCWWGLKYGISGLGFMINGLVSFTVQGLGPRASAVGLIVLGS